MLSWTRDTLRTADGLELAVYRCGRLDAPVVLLVHGYPDNHMVWTSVADRLAPHFRLLAYDVRGAGASAPASDRAGYRIEQLADDLDAVAATAGGPVHVLAHDWGSVQAWHAVTRVGAQQRYASFTSVSGPSLAYTGAWYRAALRAGERRTAARAVLRQAAASWYVAFFLLPVLPEWAWRRGLLQRVPSLRRRPADVAVPVAIEVADAVHGLQMYRANVRAAVRARPCRIPTLVLIPAGDPFITPACAAETPRRWVPTLSVRRIEGGHWTFLLHPERVTDPLTAFIDGIGGRDSWDTGRRA